jgi:uncharacterized protein DUF4383
MAFASTEDKFGIKLHSKPGPRTLAQKYSVIIGIVVLLLGILGFFVTGFSNFTEMTNHALFGLFLMNPFRNIVYIIFGLFWLLGAFALTPAGNEGVNIAAGGALLLVAVLGYLGYWSLLSIPPGVNPDNILHLVVALATLIIGSGLLGGRRSAAA